jgi:hypothetical protein
VTGWLAGVLPRDGSAEVLMFPKQDRPTKAFVLDELNKRIDGNVKTRQ